MRIVDLNEQYSDFGGGIRTYVTQKFRAAARLGHDLTVVVPGSADSVEEVEGGRLVRIAAPQIPVDRRYYIFWGASPITRLIERIQPDLIEGSSVWRGGWIAAGQRADIAKALVIHHDPVVTYPQTILRGRVDPARTDRMFRWYYRYLRRLQSHFDVTVVAAEWLAERLAALGAERPSVVRFGVDTSIFAAATPSPQLRADLLRACGVTDAAAPLFLTVGRFHPEKRIPVILDAFAKASRQRPMGLYVVGGGLDARTVEMRAAQIAGVRLAGEIRDPAVLAALYASADAYVHACPFETFGMTIGEAMAAGAPLIVPASGGACDLARPDFAEFFVPDDPASLAEALLRFAASDPKRRCAARAAARAAAPGADAHFDALFDRYQNIVECRAGEGARVQQPHPVSRTAGQAVPA